MLIANQMTMRCNKNARILFRFGMHLGEKQRIKSINAWNNNILWHLKNILILINSGVVELIRIVLCAVENKTTSKSECTLSSCNKERE